MKIKHWSGYGMITAKKIKKEVDSSGITTLVVDIEGQHKCGLVRYVEDHSTYYNWLVKKFDKEAVYGPWMFQSITAEQKEYESYGHDGKARITMKYRADGKRADICW